MRVPPSGSVTEISAHTLQRLSPMPRKQRFKPSRKPQSSQAVVANPQANEGKENNTDQSASQQSSVNDEPAAREIERE